MTTTTPLIEILPMDRWVEYKPDVRSNLIWMSLHLHKQRMVPESVRINTPWAFLPQKEFRAIVKTFGKASWDHLAYVVTAEDLKDNRRALTKKEFQSLKKHASIETKLTYALYEIIRGHYRVMRDRAGAAGMPKPAAEPVRASRGVMLLGNITSEHRDELTECLLEEAVNGNATWSDEDFYLPDLEDEGDEEALVVARPTTEEQLAGFKLIYPDGEELPEEEIGELNWPLLAKVVVAYRDKIRKGEVDYHGWKKASNSAAATVEEIE